MKLNTLKFKELRKIKKISISELSTKIGATTSAIYNWQAGRNMPSAEDLEKLAQVFEIDKADLLMSEENSSAENIYRDTLYIQMKEKSDFLKAENKRLWELIHFFTKGQAIGGDLGKWLGSYLSVKQSKMISLMVTPSKQVA